MYRITPPVPIASNLWLLLTIEIGQINCFIFWKENIILEKENYLDVILLYIVIYINQSGSNFIMYFSNHCYVYGTLLHACFIRTLHREGENLFKYYNLKKIHTSKYISM